MGLLFLERPVYSYQGSATNISKPVWTTIRRLSPHEATSVVRHDSIQTVVVLSVLYLIILCDIDEIKLIKELLCVRIKLVLLHTVFNCSEIFVPFLFFLFCTSCGNWATADEHACATSHQVAEWWSLFEDDGAKSNENCLFASASHFLGCSQENHKCTCSIDDRGTPCGKV